ncbi:hypothetical protein [Runella limosa]|uniref:hypothetical protein n=1 Tax=Runella limosa TaxID=370978 RepID=UPI00048B24BD|nr:hypothetical protein [Runella limosa]
MKNTTLKWEIMLIWTLFSVKGISQNRPDNIIILTEVSKTVLTKVPNPHEIFPTTLNTLISQGKLNTAYRFTPKPKQSLLKTTWIDEKQKLMVIPFGDLATDKVVSSGVAADEYASSKIDFFIDAISKKYPDLSRFTDEYSYRNLAIARAASLAKKNGFSSYWLLIVGHMKDNTNSSATIEKDVLNNYKTLENKIIGMIKLTNSKSNDFGIEVRHVVLDSTKKRDSGVIPEPICPNAEIIFTKTSTKDNRIEIDKSKSRLSWECTCDTVTTYRVIITGIEGAEVDSSLRSIGPTDTTNVSLKSLGAGDYNVIVSNGETSSTAYITVKGSNSMMWLIALLLLGAIIYFGKDRMKPLLAMFNKKSDKPNKTSGNPEKPSDTGYYGNESHGSGY